MLRLQPPAQFLAGDNSLERSLYPVLSTTRFPEAVGPDEPKANGRMLNSRVKLRRILRRIARRKDSELSSVLLCTPLITYVLRDLRLAS